MGQEDSARQADELEALKAIFDDDFIEKATEKPWKGVGSLREFSIRIKHPTAHLAEKFSFHVHVTLPKSYPSKAIPTLSVTKQTDAIPTSLVNKLERILNQEMQSLKGSEMLFHLITMCQDILTSELPASKFSHVGTSLAAEMIARENERNEAERLAHDDALRAERERQAHAAAQLAMEIQHNAEKKAAKQRQEKESMKSRSRALSDATERIYVDPTPVETFDESILLESGTSFDSVRLFHFRKDSLGVVYDAEPICDDGSVTHMELHVIMFDTPYYRSKQGRRKLEEIIHDTQRLSTVQHHNIQRVYACKLSNAHERNTPRIVLLCEATPSVTLYDVMKACGSFPIDTLLDVLCQLLNGLSALHAVCVTHKCLKSSLVGFDKAAAAHKAHCKILGASYISRISTLNKSNPLGLDLNDDSRWPDAWLSREMVDSPLAYPPTRDIHSLAILALELYHGSSLFDEFSSPTEAVVALPAALQAWIGSMVNPHRVTSCDILLHSFLEVSQTPKLQHKTLQGNLTMSPTSPAPVIMGKGGMSAVSRTGSRYRSDWEELEFLGKGGFGQVVKARNKLDNRVYAIKKIRLRSSDNQAKILREVNTLARLSHRSIVRYYTTWLEVSEGIDSPSPSWTDSDDGVDKTIRTNSQSVDIFQVDLSELTGASSHNSFPGIYFTEQSQTADELENDDDGTSVIDTPMVSRSRILENFTTSILYIQMEYVENLTLKERINAGIEEEEAWRLFHQLVDALVHMSNLGILHRDIKLGNIFIDANGDCKIGDFGLATSSSSTSVSVAQPDAILASVSDITMDVGTRLYVAPELVARSVQKGPKMHSKADMYSLGIVFFEMNHRFHTGAERIAVLEKLRTPEIDFPDTWDPRRRRQREIIRNLLHHDVSIRPSAVELSQSPLMPSRLEDDSLRAALNTMAKSDSPYYDKVMSLLFSQNPNLPRTAIYDADLAISERGSLDDVVEQKMREIFMLHGAVPMQPQLLLPALTAQEHDPSTVYLLDRQGDLVILPRDGLTPFARLAARTGAKRIKRYYAGNVYRSSVGGGHPSHAKAAVFDIITPSLLDGVQLAVAECMRVANEILRRFPTLTSPPYEFRISHASIGDQLLSRVPEKIKKDVLDVLCQVKPSFPQKRAAMSQLGVSRTVVDEIEVLSMQGPDVEWFLLRLTKLSPGSASWVSTAFKEIKQTLQLSSTLGIESKIVIQPFIPFPHHFKEGVMFELTRGSRRSDVLAAGGRYDHLFPQIAVQHREDNEPIRAVGMQVAMDKIGLALANYQSSNVKYFIKEQRSFGYWSPGRCNVYIISHQEGQLEERLDTAALLWSHGISADIMYESGVDDGAEAIHDLCMREGILMTVSPRPHRLGGPGYKVTMTLSRTDQEVLRPDLVPCILQHLADQRRLDMSTSGTVTAMQLVSPTNEKATHQNLDIQLLLPPERKQLKHNRKLLFDKAHEIGSGVRSSFARGVPVVAMHIPAASFSAMVENPGWLSDEEQEALRKVTATFSGSTVYVSQIREAILKRKAEGHKYLLLLSLRDDKLHLLTFH